MPVALSTRKPITKLTVGDLRAFAMWEYAIDEELQDETWVRPLGGSSVRKGSYSQIVAADFATRSGRRLQGFMIVSTAGGKVEVSAGAIVGNVRYRVLPNVSPRWQWRGNVNGTCAIGRGFVARCVCKRTKSFQYDSHFACQSVVSLHYERGNCASKCRDALGKDLRHTARPSVRELLDLVTGFVVAEPIAPSVFTGG
jgi:hypothetical protein